MKPLYDNKVSARLVIKRYKDVMFYYVKPNLKTSLYTIESCFLTTEGYHPTYFGLIPFINGEKQKYSHMFDWKNLYKSYEEAYEEIKKRNKILKSFRHKPYVNYFCLEQHYDDFRYIENTIDKLLTNLENYNGIDFFFVFAGGIQVRIHHKAIKGYTYGDQKTIKYDFSNFKEIPLQVVEEFLKIDNPEAISKQQEFIRMGEKYGWD